MVRVLNTMQVVPMGFRRSPRKLSCGYTLRILIPRIRSLPILDRKGVNIFNTKGRKI